MIKKDSITRLIDRAEQDYLKCWEVLEGLKSHSIRKELPKDLFEFQYILGFALYKIQTAVNEISKEKKKIVDRKSTLSEKYFKGRLKQLSDYQKGLSQMITIGKALGDSFVWFFYQNERKLLQEHLKREEVNTTAIGVGGIGELEFIKNVKVFDECLTIYHGISNILRIGDVSFIDLRKLEVKALGEIKSKKGEGNEIKLSLYIIGHNSRNFDFKDVSQTEEKFSNDYFDKDRLNRQLKSMAKSFDYLSKQTEKKEGEKVMDRSYLKQLEQLISTSKKGSFTFLQGGKGLLLIGIKNRGRKLSSNLLGKEALINKDQNFKDEVKLIMDKESNNNSLDIGTILYNQHSKVNILQGTMPIFWFPIDNSLIKQLYFKRAHVFTIFNAIHLVKMLESIGFENVLNEKTKKYSLIKKVGEKNLHLENIRYFFYLIKNHLQSEEAVFESINKFVKQIEENKYDRSGRITLELDQFSNF